MSAETYGDHQEAAAAALTQLIVRDLIPVEPMDVDQLLHCRDIAVDALRQRLYTLGLNTHYSASPVPAKATNLRLTQVNPNLATLLDRITFEVPTRPPDERRAASEILVRRSDDLAVELLRLAAIELLAGSHALDVASERPWLRDRGGGWYLVRDVAVTTEALLVLDSRLGEVGLLNEHHRPESALGLEEQRMVASQCARTATWHATSDTPDLATPDVPGRPAPAGPVQTIMQASDLASAQRRLATFLKPMHAGDAQYTGEPDCDATTARTVVASQLFLCKHFEDLTRGVPGTQAIRDEFATRREILQDVAAFMPRLSDAEDRGRNLRAAWQQGELTTAFSRMRRAGEVSLNPAQLLDLANATHDATHTVGKALRRELLRDTTTLRMDDPTKQVGRTRVYRRHPLERALTDLVNVPAPSAPVARYSSPLQRAALRATLDVTPTSRRAPSPYPKARAAATSDYTF